MVRLFFFSMYLFFDIGFLNNFFQRFADQPIQIRSSWFRR